MGNSPRELTWQVAEKEPIMANRVDRAPRVGSAASVTHPAEPTGHTGRKRTSAKLLNERPLWVSLLGFYAAVFPHSGGPRTKGGKIAGRRCYFSRVGSVFAPLESTCRAEQTPIMASHFGRAPRWQCRRGYFSAGVDCPYGKLPNF